MFLIPSVLLPRETSGTLLAIPFSINKRETVVTDEKGATILSENFNFRNDLFNKIDLVITRLFNKIDLLGTICHEAGHAFMFKFLTKRNPEVVISLSNDQRKNSGSSRCPGILTPLQNTLVCAAGPIADVISVIFQIISLGELTDTIKAPFLALLSLFFIAGFAQNIKRELEGSIHPLSSKDTNDFGRIRKQGGDRHLASARAALYGTSLVASVLLCKYGWICLAIIGNSLMSLITART